MAAVTAPARRSVQPALQREDRRRPDLRIAVRPEHRKRIGYAVAAFLAVALFAIVGFQTILNSGQATIDSLNRRIAAEQERALELRLEIAELQSPQYITTAAATRLGMIPAPTPVYLQPRATDDDRAAELPPVTKSWTPASSASSSTNVGAASASTAATR